MNDLTVPSEQDFVEAFGAVPTHMPEGEAVHLVEVESGSRTLRFSYDVVERSVRVGVSDQGRDLTDLYFEGLEVISLVSARTTAGLEVGLSGDGYRVKVEITVFPEVSVVAHVPAA